jgi:hypothetical protein
MAEETAVRGPVGVKDVPAEAFIKAFAAHLKKNDKVRCWKARSGSTNSMPHKYRDGGGDQLSAGPGHGESWRESTMNRLVDYSQPR